MVYVPIERPEDWKQFLADPDKQWKKGYSAYSLAHLTSPPKRLPLNLQLLII